jgi:tetratricopeptide (TPR) repeat protein
MEVEMANLTASQELFNQLQIDLATVPIDRLNTYIAVEYYLVIKDEPLPDAKNIEKVDHYLLAFKKLCDISAWQQASHVLQTQLDIPHTKQLHEQLGLWGYYREQIDAYKELLGRLDRDLQFICLYGLGRAYCYLGLFQEAIAYHHQQLELASETKDRRQEAKAWSGLGYVYSEKEELVHLFTCCQQQLKIAKEISDSFFKADALGELSYYYEIKGKLQKSLQLRKQVLGIAREIGNLELESIALMRLGAYFINRGNGKQAVSYLVQAQALVMIANKGRESRIWNNLGMAYIILRKYDLALDHLLKALQMSNEMRNDLSMMEPLCSLANLYGEQREYQIAISYMHKALDISSKLDCTGTMFICIANLSYYYSRIGQINLAEDYVKRLQEIAKKSQHIEAEPIVIAAIGNIYWCKKQYLQGILLIAKSLMSPKMRKSLNLRILFEKAFETISETIVNNLKSGVKRLLQLFKFKKRNQEPT